MDIVKYFYEEPAALELLSPEGDADPRRRTAPLRAPRESLPASPYHRGYLAGTDLDAGRIGLTAIAHPDAFVEPLLDWLDGPVWQHVSTAGAIAALTPPEVRGVLLNPDDTALLVHGAAPLAPEHLRAAIGANRRYTLPGLRPLLDTGATVLVPEPAHAGFDWSLFARRPMLEAFVEAFERHPADGVRRFALPVRKARSEEKFYFELWQLNAGPLPDHIREF